MWRDLMDETRRDLNFNENMGRRRGSETPQRTGRGTGPGEPPSLVDQHQLDSHISDGVRSRRRTMVISEENASGVQIQHSKDCSYEYEEDPWERSPKTDYTYSRSGSYTVRTSNNGYESPNMSRRSMHSGSRQADSSTGVSTAVGGIQLGSEASTSEASTSSTLNSSWQQQQLRQQQQTSQQQQLSSSFRMSESRSFGNNSSHLGVTSSSSRRASGSNHPRVGASTQTSPGGQFLLDEDMEDELTRSRHSTGSGQRWGQSDRMANEISTSSSSQAHLRHLHGLDDDMEISTNGGARRKRDADRRKWDEMTLLQYVYYTIVTTVSSVLSGKDTLHQAANSNNVAEETVGAATVGYTDAASTKRRRRGMVVETADKETGVHRSIVHSMLSLIFYLPYSLLHLCWVGASKLVKLPGVAADGVWKEVKYCMSGITGVSMTADAYVLSRTSEVRRGSGCCWWLLLFILFPLFLIGCYYLMACGGLGGGLGGYLPSNQSSIYQLINSPPAETNQVTKESKKPIIIPPPSAGDISSGREGTGLVGGITMAEIDQRIRELFHLLYFESSGKTSTEQRRALEEQRGAIESRLGQLQVTLEVMSSKLVTVEARARELEASAPAGSSSAGQGEVQVLANLQTEMRRDIDGVLSDLQKLRTEQKILADAAMVAARGDMEEAAKSREVDLERRLRDGYRLELATLQQKQASTAGRDRDSLTRLEEELNRLKAQLLQLSANQNKEAELKSSAELDPKYLKMVQDNRKQIEAVLLEIKLLKEVAEQNKAKPLSDTSRESGASIDLKLSEEELNDRIRILASSLAVDVRADHQKEIDRQGEELRKSLSAMEVKLLDISGRLTGLESVAPSGDGRVTKEPSATDYGREMEIIRVSLGDLSGQLKTMSERFTKATDQINDNGEKTRAHAVSIAGLESRLLNVSAGNTKLTEAYDNLLLKMSNCCRSTVDLNAAIRAGIQEYMDLVMSNKAGSTGSSKTGTVGPSAFALWLNSQFNRPGDVDSKMTAMAESLHKQFTEGQQTMMTDLKASISSSSSTSITQKTSREDILAVIREQLSIYDADKTGKFDFALETAGGSVVSVRCTRTYMPRTGLYSVFGVPLWYTSNSPRVTIQPGLQPGECWAFEGSEGFLVVQPSSPLVIREVSLEHISKRLSPTQRIDSAPKNFTIWSLQEEYDKNPVLIGNFTYDESIDKPLQIFPIENADGLVSRLVELKIHSNHGHPEYTCLYRFRVHGSLAYTSV